MTLFSKHVLAQIAPQRSTQYAAVASQLAAPELQIAPLGASITEINTLAYGAETYLLLTLDAPLPQEALPLLSQLAATTVFFEYFDEIANEPGPFLRPLPTLFAPSIPSTLATARRYRGKTNELLCHFLCNVARFSSGFASTPWDELALLDPLAGGGTILFTGLVLGAQVAGIDHNAQDMKSTATFLQQFMRENGIACRSKEERLRKIGRRWRFSIGARGQRAQSCLLVNADTVQAVAVLDGFRPHLIVTDLPYGVQHQGPLHELLHSALPVWSACLRPGGALAFSWDATRFLRAEMLQVMKDATDLDVCEHAPFDALAHTVDRVIKQRDIIVAVKR